MEGRPAPGARMPPILFVDGWTPFPMPYVHIRHYYKRRGFKVRLVPFRHKDMRDIETYARHLTRQAHDLATKFDSRQVDIIAFSMGGVAALYAIKRLGLAPYVRRFVSYGSPYNGARVAAIGFFSIFWKTVGRQLLPDSTFVKTLHADPLPEGPVYISLCASNDMVCTPRDCHLVGAKNRCLRGNHWTFLYENRIHELIITKNLG